jgi:hypothetical protein
MDRAADPTTKVRESQAIMLVWYQIDPVEARPARRFQGGAMPWLGGRTPADTPAQPWHAAALAPYTTGG